MQEIINQIHTRVAAVSDDILKFFREIVAIPSMDSDIAAVGQRVGEEMQRLGYDQVYVDKYGSIVGKIGSGPRILLYDSHLDTVGIGDPTQWPWDPFQGKVEEGMLYARGALDEKNSTPGMVYGLSLARDLGLLEGFTAYYLGNIEEWCDGIGCQAFVEWEGVQPDFVVIGEPTNMKVYRGHKGRIEMEVVAKGKSAHAASNHMGDNAIYKMLPVVQAIDEMGPKLRTHEFLGQGKITVTRISSVSPSDNAVPDECRIFIDRRITFGDTRESVRAEIEATIPEAQQADFEVRDLVYDTPSHTGAVFVYDKYFPAWALSAEHPLVQAGVTALQAVLPTADPFGQGKWDFSTNGNYWCGKAGIPSIGFGPGNEIYAHAVNEHVSLADVVAATKFYALLPAMIKG